MRHERERSSFMPYYQNPSRGMVQTFHEPGSINGVRARVRAFMYDQLPSRNYVEIPIHVIPGMSPYRQAIDHSPSATQISVLTRQMPLDNIIIWTPTVHPVPPWLQKQVERMPREAQGGLSAMPGPASVLLKIRLFTRYRLKVLYNLQAAQRITSVTLDYAGEEHDITEHILGSQHTLDLAQIYNRGWKRLVAGHLLEQCSTCGEFLAALIANQDDGNEEGDTT